METQLQELKKEIENKCNGEEWFFPDSKDYTKVKECGVKGYFGTQDIIFIGLNPSKGNSIIKSKGFPSPADIFLYNNLKKYDFQNAHITDLIKIKLSRKEVLDFLKDNEKMKEQLEFLKKEFDIIKPKVVILMHSTILRYIKSLLQNKKIKYFYVWHYACASQHYKTQEELKNKWDSVLRKVKEEYVSLEKKLNV